MAAAPFMIQSANGALTIDISNAVYSEGTSIVGNPLGGGGGTSTPVTLPRGGSGKPIDGLPTQADQRRQVILDRPGSGPHLPPVGIEGQPIQASQSWKVIPDPLGSSHYLIVSGACNLCIGIGVNVPPGGDVTDDATDRGAVLTLQEQETSNNHYQLWDFLPPTGGAGNSVFIQSPQTGYVIELSSHGTTACPLVVNPRRISNETYQLWTAVGQFGEIALPVVTMAQLGGPLQGSSQYVLLPPNQGDHLIGITVTIDIIEDVVVDACSIQINCNTPYLGPDGTDTEDYDRDAQWMQFGLFMQNNQLMLFNQIWHRLSEGVPASEFTSETEWSAPLLQLQNDTIPAGTRIIMNLCTDQDDFAIGMTGLALDSTGLPLAKGTPIYWPALGRDSYHATVDGGKVHQKAMAPVGAFQVVFCSNPQVQSAPAQFTSGMGTITVTASPGIAALNSWPNPSGGGTAEDSNMPYDLVPSGTARLIAQPFGFSAPTGQ